MKRILGIALFSLATLLFSSGKAEAREGRLDLSSPTVACEGISVWQSSAYRITGRCQGLVYPYQSQFDHYVIWVTQENGNTVRVDDIDKGYFEGNVTESFTDISITAESSSSPRRPSDKRIVAGSISSFSFDTSRTTAPTQPAATATPAPQAGSPATSPSTMGSFVGRILRALLIIIAVIVIITIIASLIFRRRGSVSA